MPRSAKQRWVWIVGPDVFEPADIQMLMIDGRDKVGALREAGVFPKGVVVETQMICTGRQGSRNQLTILCDDSYQAKNEELRGNRFMGDFFAITAPSNQGGWAGFSHTVPRYGNFVFHYSRAGDENGDVSEDMPDVCDFHDLVDDIREAV